MQDKNYKSSNLIKRKKKILLLKMWVIFIIAILIIGGGAYFSNTENVKISTISINDTTFFNKQEVEKIAQEELANTHFLIFGKNNILLLPRNNIEKRIKEYHQAIKSVSISLSGLQAISINIEEYEPQAVWCSREGCYYLNEDGFIFVKAPPDYDRKLVEFHDWIHNDPIGQTYIDAETFKKITMFVGLVAGVPLKVISINTEDGLTFSLRTDVGTRLLYEINDDPKEVADNLNTVIEKDAINRAQLNNIDYIDLRFGNKVYYKIR